MKKSVSRSPVRGVRGWVMASSGRKAFGVWAATVANVPAVMAATSVMANSFFMANGWVGFGD